MKWTLSLLLVVKWQALENPVWTCLVMLWIHAQSSDNDGYQSDTEVKGYIKKHF